MYFIGVRNEDWLYIKLKEGDSEFVEKYNKVKFYFYIVFNIGK